MKKVERKRKKERKKERKQERKKERKERKKRKKEIKQERMKEKIKDSGNSSCFNRAQHMSFSSITSGSIESWPSSLIFIHKSPGNEKSPDMIIDARKTENKTSMKFIS